MSIVSNTSELDFDITTSTMDLHADWDQPSEVAVCFAPRDDSTLAARLQATDQPQKRYG